VGATATPLKLTKPTNAIYPAIAVDWAKAAAGDGNCAAGRALPPARDGEKTTMRHFQKLRGTQSSGWGGTEFPL